MAASKDGRPQEDRTQGPQPVADRPEAGRENLGQLPVQGLAAVLLQ